MTDEEKEFVKKVNVDKAMKKTTPCIVFSIISLLTYVIPFIFGEFDFGFVFEVLTLIFIIIARINMSNYNEDGSKLFIIIAMIPIGWLLIYDFITVLASVTDVLMLPILGYDFLFQEGFTIVILFLLYKINKDLRKADNPEKYKESTDWFYER